MNRSQLLAKVSLQDLATIKDRFLVVTGKLMPVRQALIDALHGPKPAESLLWQPTPPRLKFGIPKSHHPAQRSGCNHIGTRSAYISRSDGHTRLRTRLPATACPRRPGTPRPGCRELDITGAYRSPAAGWHRHTGPVSTKGRRSNSAVARSGTSGGSGSENHEAKDTL